MRVLSASEAISPAISRTKLVLFKPFRWGRTWKLAMSSYLGLSSMGILLSPVILFAFLPAIHRSSIRLLVMTAIIFGIAFFGWVYYLMTRLQFAFFDILVNRGDFVAPAWRKYGTQARRWFWFEVVLGVPFGLLVGLPFVLLFRSPFMMAANSKHVPHAAFPFDQFFIAFFAIFFGMLLLLLVGTLLSDFVLPSLALEDVSLKEGLRRFWVLIQNEPGQLIGYTCLKGVLGFVGNYVVLFGAEIAFLLAILVLFLIGFLFASLVHLMGVPWDVLRIVGLILAVPCYLAFFFYVVPVVLGCFFTFLQAWGVYFLGGRYPLLGELLEGSTPNAPWPFPYPPLESQLVPPAEL